jgi:hypothetical protein
LKIRYVVAAAALALLVFLWHPVCVPIATDSSLESRTGERLWGVQTFQKKNGVWYQCKPWLARQMFF